MKIKILERPTVLYKQMNPYSEIIAGLQAGDVVTFIGVMRSNCEEWIKVRADGVGVGYLKNIEYLKLKYVMLDQVETHVFRSCSEAIEPQCKLTKMDVFKIEDKIKESNQYWYRIKYGDGKKGYIKSDVQFTENNVTLYRSIIPHLAKPDTSERFGFAFGILLSYIFRDLRDPSIDLSGFVIIFQFVFLLFISTVVCSLLKLIFDYIEKKKVQFEQFWTPYKRQYLTIWFPAALLCYPVEKIFDLEKDMLGFSASTILAIFLVFFAFIFYIIDKRYFTHE